MPPGDVAARNVPHTPPGFPVDVGAACTPPGNVAAARNVAGHANLHGGVRPRPTGHGNTAATPDRPRFGKPPLRPNGNPQFSIFVLNLRKVVGRGLDPAAGTLRQTPRPPHTARFSCRRRGGVYAARGCGGCPERCGPRKFARRGTTPPYGTREHGSSDRRSQQDKIARAACRPPLRPNGNSQFSIFVRNLRKVVGRGLDPAAGTSRQTRRFQNKPPGFLIDVGAACTPPGNVAAARNVPGHANLHSGVRPRPTG